MSTRLHGEVLVKSLIKLLAAKIDVDTYQRLMVYSILKQTFKEIKSARLCLTRESLWDECLEELGGPSAKITYVEFGVHRGYSIKYFAERNRHEESRFIGLDSFEGLPEDWGKMPKGTFATDGNIPKSEDQRISFIKGWFQNTWAELRRRLPDAGNLVVHYDADLYSSTLFALSAMDSLRAPYVAIFDEFTGHEARALYNYTQAYNSSVTFLAQTLLNRCPWQVMCRICPSSH